MSFGNHHKKEFRIRSINRKERRVRKEEVGATGWSPFFAAHREKICASRGNHHG
jgi:hypothetical protein